jgi:hypothetical protein
MVAGLRGLVPFVSGRLVNEALWRFLRCFALGLVATIGSHFVSLRFRLVRGTQFIRYNDPHSAPR